MSIHIRVYPQTSSFLVQRRRAQQVRRQQAQARQVAVVLAERMQQQRLQAMYGIGSGWGNANPFTVGAPVLPLRQQQWGSGPSFANQGGYGGYGANGGTSGNGGYGGAAYGSFGGNFGFGSSDADRGIGGYRGYGGYSSPPPPLSAGAGYPAYAGAQACAVAGRPPQFSPEQSYQSGGYDAFGFRSSAFAPQAQQGWGARFGGFFGF